MIYFNYHVLWSTLKDYVFTQDPYWNKREANPEEQARWAVISSFLERVSKQVRMKEPRLLDLGCGRGWLSNLLSKFGECEGVDPVEAVVEHARHLYSQVDFKTGTVQSLRREENFSPYDIVICSEVIEHVPYSEQEDFIEGIKGVLSKEGFVVLTTPRFEVFGKWMEFTNNRKQPIDDWLSELQVKDLFESNGFRAIEVERIYFDLSTRKYSLSLAGIEGSTGNLLPLYQVWSFQNI